MDIGYANSQTAKQRRVLQVLGGFPIKFKTKIIYLKIGGYHIFIL